MIPQSRMISSSLSEPWRVTSVDLVTESYCYIWERELPEYKYCISLDGRTPDPKAEPNEVYEEANRSNMGPSEAMTYVLELLKCSFPKLDVYSPADLQNLFGGDDNMSSAGYQAPSIAIYPYRNPMDTSLLYKCRTRYR